MAATLFSEDGRSGCMRSQDIDDACFAGVIKLGDQVMTAFLGSNAASRSEAIPQDLAGLLCGVESRIKEHVVHHCRKLSKNSIGLMTQHGGNLLQALI